MAKHKTVPTLGPSARAGPELAALGPIFTGRLADLDAEVLKVDRPGSGDFTRSLLPGMFTLGNCCKRNAVTDLLAEAGRGDVVRLADRECGAVQAHR